MRIIDKKFRRNVPRYILQCALATLIIAIVLVFLDVLTHTATVAALGASSFIAFTICQRTMPLNQDLWLEDTSLGYP